MGYSHYFYHRKEFSVPEWKQVKSFAAELFDVCKANGVRLAGPDGAVGTKPYITAEYISFNGADGSCEGMLLDRVPDPVDVRRHVEHQAIMRQSGFETSDDTICFGCCKTRYYPYDIAVVALLAGVDMLVPDALKVSSDGEYEELRPGIELAKHVLSVLLPDRAFVSSLEPGPASLAAPIEGDSASA